jgi:hypothetical protein
MARYIGPKSKIARRFGEPIFGADKVLSKRNFPPGQHGNNRRRITFETEPKTLGEYVANLNLHKEVKVKVPFEVVAE